MTLVFREISLTPLIVNVVVVVATYWCGYNYSDEPRKRFNDTNQI